MQNATVISIGSCLLAHVIPSRQRQLIKLSIAFNLQT